MLLLLLLFGRVGTSPEIPVAEHSIADVDGVVGGARGLNLVEHPVQHGGHPSVATWGKDGDIGDII